MLGIREPGIYGDRSFAALCDFIKAAVTEVGAECELYQSNHEGCIVDKIQEAYGKFDGIVINPAAYTHTSVAIADALSAVAIPTVEVHISNVMERESFRHHSFVTPIAKKTYMGLGFEGYRRAVRYLALGEE
jgi:3-dehydroquinate dehydratase-2